MKKQGLLLMIVLVLLVACTPKAYKEHLTTGRQAFDQAHFIEAKEAFLKAKREKATDEMEVWVQQVEQFIELEETVTIETLDEFIARYEKYQTFENQALVKEDVKRIREVAAVQQERLVEAKEQVEHFTMVLEEIERALNDAQYDVVDILISSQEEVLSKMPTLFAPLLEKLNVLKERLASERLVEKDKESEKMNEQTSKPIQSPESIDVKPKEGKKPTEEVNAPEVGRLTTKEAEKLVEKHIRSFTQAKLEITFDHEDEFGNYIVQAYEVVMEEDGSGHTATLGWFAVNPKTKEVEQQM